MKRKTEQICDNNKVELEHHNENFDFIANNLVKKGHYDGN